MNELQLLKEQWSEQMWEQRANGIETITFEAWLAKKKATDEFFKNWNKVKAESAEMVAEARCS